MKGLWRKMHQFHFAGMTMMSNARKSGYLKGRINIP